MHTSDKAAEIGDQSGERQAQGLAPRQQHIVMSGDKVTRTRCRSRAQAALHAIALGRIADFLGDGEADPGIRLGRRHDLQPKRRAPGALAPGGSQKLCAAPKPAQRPGLVGRHPANNP
jgi:hypothetical protein